MRLLATASTLALLLTGCGNDVPPMGPTSITLEYPATPIEKSQAAADAQCKNNGKTAKFRDIEKRVDANVAVFDCI